MHLFFFHLVYIFVNSLICRTQIFPFLSDYTTYIQNVEKYCILYFLKRIFNIFLILFKTIQLSSLAILMKYFFKENKLTSYRCFSNNMYMINNRFCLLAAKKMIYGLTLVILTKYHYSMLFIIRCFY